MKTNLVTKKVLGTVFGLSLLLGIGMASSSVAQAQYQDPYWRQEQIRRQREWERQQRRRNQRVYDNRGYDNRGYDNRGYNNRGYDNLPDYGGSSQLRQTALNAGYNQGIKDGRKDRSRGERFEYRDEGGFQSASGDYNSRFGNRALYQEYYRQGFINGYTDGYRGY